MANVNIAPAARKGLNPHNYNPITIASLDYGEFVNTRSVECEKSDNWKQFKGKGFLRLAALDFPAYGRTFLKQAAFFVPYYQILENIDGFRANKVMDMSEPTTMPFVRADVCQQICSNSAFSTLVTSRTYGQSAPSRSAYDFICCVSNQGSSQYDYYKLNYKGKKVYKWLKSLGFDWFQYPESATFATVQSGIVLTNALSILCFAKVWLDYFCNIHLYEGNQVLQILQCIKHHKNFVLSSTTLYDASTGELKPYAVRLIFEGCLVPFESSLYLDAWNSEGSPIGDISNERTDIVNGSLVSPHLYNNTNTTDQISDALRIGPTLMNSSSASLNYLTQFGINTLESFFKYIKRNNLFGSESAKQAFARFGIKGDDYNALFARKLFEGSQEIDFSAVMSNSNTYDASTTDGSVLGAYAGVGLCSLDFNYTYKCSDYGLILNLAWLQIIPMQIHGFDPSVIRLKPFDWWTPEFDGKALRAIPNMEIAAPQGTVTNSGQLSNSIYGFCGLYDDYRRMRDMVLGDFCFEGANKFFFGRDLSERLETYRFPVKPQTEATQYFSRYGDDPELTDPFQFANSNGDRFYLQMIWDIQSERQLLSTADSLDLNGSGEIQTTTSSNPNA